MTPSVSFNAGIDVSKSWLDLAFSKQGRTQRFDNTEAGHAALVAVLRAKTGEVHVTLEPTGGYERGVHRRLHEAGIAVHRANPRQVRYFARARGQLAKTDPLDARVLSAYGAAMACPPTPPVPELIETFQALVNRRIQLVEMRKAERQRLATALPAIVASLQTMLAIMDQQIQSIETEIDQLVDSQPELQTRINAVEQIVGFGRTTAAALLAAMPELGTLRRKQATALAGLAPFARQSGIMKGARHIAHGRFPARRALYMAAFSARQHNPEIKAFFERLTDNEKPYKVATVAVMRKLLIAANAKCRQALKEHSC